MGVFRSYIEVISVLAATQQYALKQLVFWYLNFTLIFKNLIPSSQRISIDSEPFEWSPGIRII